MDNEKDKKEIENINNKSNAINEDETLHPGNITKIQSRFFGMMGGSFPGVNPLLEKMNEEHITTLLQQKSEDSKRSFNKMIVDRLTMLFIVVAVIGLVIFLTITIAKSNPSLYSEILKYSMSCILGIAGGYGFGYNKGIKNTLDGND